jgi:hypothetical protein
MVMLADAWDRLDPSDAKAFANLRLLSDGLLAAQATLIAAMTGRRELSRVFRVLAGDRGQEDVVEREASQ